MKEYSIYIRQGNGRPYTIGTYNSIYDAQIALGNMVRLEEERQKPYYVDNDFWDNQYSLISNLRYFCIREREVSEWKKYCNTNISGRSQDDNVIYFTNYLK